MRNLIPTDINKIYFPVFEDMTRKYILSNKNGHKRKSTPIEGLQGEHTIIFGTIKDAKKVFPDFVELVKK